MDLLSKIRCVQDFPVKGVLFRDITTLLKDPEALNYVAQKLAERYKDSRIDLVGAIEARGFILGGILANLLGAGFIPVRKPGKLPGEVVKAEYQLEYSKNILELHTDAVKRGQRVLIVDDLLATGGTARAAAELVEKLGGEVVELAFLIELTQLKGREQLKGYSVYSLIEDSR